MGETGGKTGETGDMRGLTSREMAFVDAYLANEGNASAAPRKAGYPPKQAHKRGSEIAKRAQVVAEIARRREAIHTTVNRVLDAAINSSRVGAPVGASYPSLGGLAQDIRGRRG